MYRFVAIIAVLVMGCGPFDGIDDSGLDSSLADVSLVPDTGSGHLDTAVGEDTSTGHPDTSTSEDTGTVQNEMRLYKSGSRIKAKVMTTADGAQAFMGWYDTALEVDCYMGLVADDGKKRCLPSESYIYNQLSFQVFYSDPSCTKRLYYTARLKTCLSVEVGWIRATTSDCSPGEYSIYRDGHVYDGDTVYQKSSSDGSCIDVTVSYDRYQFLDSLGEKQPPEIFAEASVSFVD